MDNKKIRDTFETEDPKKKGHREYNRKISRKGDKLGGNIGTLLCTILILIKLIGKREIDAGLFSVLLCVRGIQNLVEGTNLSEKKYKIILGIIELVLCMLLTVFYIGGLFL